METKTNRPFANRIKNMSIENMGDFMIEICAQLAECGVSKEAMIQRIEDKIA